MKSAGKRDARKIGSPEVSLTRMTAVTIPENGLIHGNNRSSLMGRSTTKNQRGGEQLRI
jgi:hypothetical protein